MNAFGRWSLITAVAFTAGLAMPGAAAAASPDFNSVQWTALGCPNADLITHDSPSSADFAGSSAAGDEPAYYAFDSTFLYFRFRMSGNPVGGGAFAQVAWTALMQVPAGDRFRYQYQLSLNGKTDTIEIWKNDPATAQVIDFTPLFHDDSETQLFSTAYNAGGMTLARSLSDGSGHYFLDFAFPVSQLISVGAISSASDLQQSFFYPATSTNPSNYNKSHLNCPFQPYTILNITKDVTPTVAPTNTVTPITYTLNVHNAMGLAVGMTVSDVAFPAYLSNVAVGVTSDDPAATYVVSSTDPLLVQFPTLAANKNATVTITADAMPGCGNPDFMNTATVGSVNAMEHTASALLGVQNGNGIELCDGLDNDCDGQVDEGGNLCDDANPCTVDACNGALGCSHAVIEGCEPCAVPGDCTDDGNACTTATCNGGVCGVNTTPGCEPCAVPGDCADDANACTTATCTGGVCGVNTTPNCEPCTVPANCADDGNACTTATCNGGVCGVNTTPNCEPCTVPGNCADDGNACTTATCNGGVCGVNTTPNCEPCTVPGDCADDANACTTATCTGGICGKNTTPGCEPCAVPGDCADDANACTTATCTGGICGKNTTPGCEPCAVPGDCADDANACTTATCTGGICGKNTTPGCEPCAVPGDCADDANACTTATCTGGICGKNTTPGCEPCAVPGDCADDANACTTATCTGGVCGVTTTPACEPCVVPGDCADDANACTTATCNAGICGVTTAPSCAPCTVPGDCADDNNACTTATCNAGICGKNTTPGCEPCTVPGDCADDGNACTTATCNGGVCGVSVTPACEPCAQPGDCTDDSNPCTSPTCQGSVCGVFVIEGCEPCETPGDCTDDGDACTTATCTNGVCAVDITPDCKPCATASDCIDGHACTSDQCNGGICANPSIPDCQECETARDCNDQNACTTELCAEGVCGHLTVDGCVPCTTNADCNDLQACTADVCGADGSCQVSTIPGCKPCNTASDCNDGNACTTDTCSGGTCGNKAIDHCGTENCTDGVDNDGDGLVDCADSDCADNPVCKTEICGNCIDDDGDGLVDYDDPDCCDNTNALVIGRMSVRTQPQVKKNRLRLKARYASQAPAGFDPAAQGTHLQVRDADGTFICQLIPFKADPRSTKKNVFKFRDKTGLMANGLRRAKFKVQKKKNDRVMFRTNGKKMSFREPVGTEVTVTLAVGNQCTQQVANLRTRKGVKTGRALVFKPVKIK